MSRQYLCAGKAVEGVMKGIPFKAYCANTRIGKVDYALACETLKYLDPLKEIIRRSGVDLHTSDVNPGIFLVMAYELLFGRNKISGGGAVKRSVMLHVERMRLELSTIMSEGVVEDPKELISEVVRKSCNMPKYIRVNTLKITLNQGLESIRKLVKDAVLDETIPSLVTLPASSPSFGENSLVKTGCLIIQDKASCFPSQVLCDAWSGGDVVDACAAPGNKTSHMAAELFQKPMYSGQRIFAFDKDKTRAQLLTQRLIEAGAELVVPEHKDFLSIDVSDQRYQSVRSVLCDPSCSGSGVLRAIERVVEHKDAELELARAAKLGLFQQTIIRKAASFPNVTRIVYSTCSLHVAENEDVVAAFLKENPAWNTVSPSSFSHWKRRGLPHSSLSLAQSRDLIRCFPEDGMNGFFVALLQKYECSDPASSSANNTQLSDSNFGRRINSTHKCHLRVCSTQQNFRKRKKTPGVFWRPLSSSNSNRFVIDQK
jgi:25S rRNA (cytosine2278-C5)-methyltransferase